MAGTVGHRTPLTKVISRLLFDNLDYLSLLVGMHFFALVCLRAREMPVRDAFPLKVLLVIITGFFKPTPGGRVAHTPRQPLRRG